MEKCLVCEKEIFSVEGRRKKKFCGSACRLKHWVKNNPTPEKFKKIPLEEWKDIESKLKLVNGDKFEKSNPLEITVGIDIVQPTKLAKVVKQVVVPETIPDNDEIQKQIEAILAEKIPSERNTPQGKKSWLFDQNKRINQLKNKLQ